MTGPEAATNHKYGDERPFQSADSPPNYMLTYTQGIMERAAVFLVKNYLVGYHAPFLIESDGVAILHVLLMAILNYEKMFFWYIEECTFVYITYLS